MTQQTCTSLRVFLEMSQDKTFVGHLALQNGIVYFEYDAQFLRQGLDISPYHLPLRPGVQVCKEQCFEGLFGLFNDSLPDGWGRLLLDRKLTHLGYSLDHVGVLDRLSYVGRQGFGALAYEPEVKFSGEFMHKDLDTVFLEIQSVQAGDEAYLDELLKGAGSSAGARPKILLQMDDQPWIVKFRSSIDPEDMGAIEYAYHLMAQSAGLDVPEAKLCTSKNHAGYFACKRFDRHNDQRVHMHTLSGLLHADHRYPSLDYQDVLKATAWLCKDPKELEKQFRLAAFNVFSHNRDDHAKNFAFLMSPSGSWKTAPAYDLTFSYGPGGEHSTMCMGEGRSPQRVHLQKLAELVGLEQKQTEKVLDEVQEGVSQWESWAKQANVSKGSRERIAKILL